MLLTRDEDIRALLEQARVIAMVGAVLLVSDVVLGRVPAAIVSAVAACCFGLLWGVFPWMRRRRGEHV